MREFLVGLLVLLMMGVFSVLGLLLFPLLLLVGLFLRVIIGLIFLILAVWVLGKVTLALIEQMRKRSA